MRNIYVFIKNVLFIPLFLLLSIAGYAQEVTITTDKLDYYPGEWVTITGNGWQAEEFVMLSLTHTGDFIPEHTHLPFDVQADGAGDIYHKWYVSDAELGTAFLLSARGLSSGWEAETVFTDSQLDTFSPNTGTVGTAFTITGVGFGDGAEEFQAFFSDGVHEDICIILNRVNNETFTGVIPAGLIIGEQYDVTVYNKQNNNSVGRTLDNVFTYCIAPAIVSATAAASPICLGATTTLTANGVTGTNAVVNWYTTSGGIGTSLGTGFTLSAGPGTYYAYVTGDCGNAQASVTVGLIPDSGVESVTGGQNPLCN